LESKVSDKTDTRFPDNGDEYTGIIPVIRAFENLARQIKKLNRVARDLACLSPDIAATIERYSQLDADQLAIEPFIELSADIREIQEHIGDILGDKYMSRSFLTKSEERLGETADAAVNEIEDIEREPAPSLRTARARALERSGQRPSDQSVPEPVQPVNNDEKKIREAEPFLLNQELEVDSSMQNETGKLLSPEVGAEASSAGPVVDRRKVFVVHGRNLKARDALFAFLRSLDLSPVEWEEAVSWTGETAPYIGEVLRVALPKVCAVVVILSGDDEAKLRQQFGSTSETLIPQPRPNVFFEAGMAIALRLETTIFVQIGLASGFSDIAGRHLIRIDESDHQAIAALRGRLIECGCNVLEVGTDWLRTGDFDSAVREGAGKAPTEMAHGIPESDEQSGIVAELETPTSGTDQNASEGVWNGLVPWFRLTGIEGELSEDDEVLLVLGNYAETTVTEVRLEFLDPLIDSAGQDVSKQPKLKQSIAIMKPNQEVVFPIGNASDLSLMWVLGKLQGSYRVAVTSRNAATGVITTSQHNLELASAFPFLLPDR
jgi:predicted nucleotide-binding protein